MPMDGPGGMPGGPMGMPGMLMDIQECQWRGPGMPMDGPGGMPRMGTWNANGLPGMPMMAGDPNGMPKGWSWRTWNA